MGSGRTISSFTSRSAYRYGLITASEDLASEAKQKRIKEIRDAYFI
tara:strand:+ start:514 stop:651 length:138 start_codon:yes stop_codon:yes gene_type:complete